MDLGISGETALVLGGSQGLGLSCARSLVGAGVRVAVNGRDPSRLQEAVHSLGDLAVAIPGDVSRPDSRKAIVEQAQEQLGRISILVTNAGGPPPGPVERHSHGVWMEALETNMLAALEFAVALVPGMKEAGFGRIVNVTSFTVPQPYANMGLATGVRAGLTGAMASLAREVAPYGVTVNNVLPGLMDTGALERVYNAQAEREGITPQVAKQRMAESIPMGRLGTAEDFGPACAFLCSRLASYITGVNLRVDGGLVQSML